MRVGDALILSSILKLIFGCLLNCITSKILLVLIYPTEMNFLLFVIFSACLPALSQQIFIESTYHVLGASWREWHLGCDLRDEQELANIPQWEIIFSYDCGRHEALQGWICLLTFSKSVQRVPVDIGKFALWDFMINQIPMSCRLNGGTDLETKIRVILWAASGPKWGPIVMWSVVT